MDHNLFIHLLANAYLHCRNNAKILADINKGPINIYTQILKISLDKYLRIKLSNEITSVYCTLEETPKHLLVALSFFIPNSSV